MADRYKTGQECTKSGTYDFDGYLDGSTSPVPTANELSIPLSKGETFPPIKSADKGCYWLFSY